MASVASRILSRKAGAMLARNTAVSCTVFAVGLGLLYLLVERGHLSEMPAMVVSTLLSNTLHYVLGRSWIYRGTERGWGDGYFYFLVNAGIGMAITFALFWAVLQWTAINYLLARVLVSVVAGLASFLLNAMANFRQL